jgi:hypothetical protein
MPPSGLSVTGQTVTGWFGWAAIVARPAFLLHSFAIFPEIPVVFGRGPALDVLRRAEEAGRSPRQSPDAARSGTASGMSNPSDR